MLTAPGHWLSGQPPPQPRLLLPCASGSGRPCAAGMRALLLLGVAAAAGRVGLVPGAHVLVLPLGGWHEVCGPCSTPVVTAGILGHCPARRPGHPAAVAGRLVLHVGALPAALAAPRPHPRLSLQVRALHCLLEESAHRKRRTPRRPCSSTSYPPPIKLQAAERQPQSCRRCEVCTSKHVRLSDVEYRESGLSANVSDGNTRLNEWCSTLV